MNNTNKKINKKNNTDQLVKYLLNNDMISLMSIYTQQKWYKKYNFNIIFEKCFLYLPNSSIYHIFGYMFLHGFVVKRNRKIAMKYFHKSLEQNNNPNSQYHLGYMYYYGPECDIDYDQVLKYYQLSAEQNHIDALYRLGDMYYYGIGCEIDYHKAYKLFQKACYQNHANAQYSLGYMYYQGDGVKEDKYIAYKYLRLSVMQGNKHAKKLIENIDKNYVIDKLFEELDNNKKSDFDKLFEKLDDNKKINNVIVPLEEQQSLSNLYTNCRIKLDDSFSGQMTQ